MKQILIFLSIFMLAVVSVSGQNEFHKRYGSSYSDRAYRTIETSDGNFLVVGETDGFGSGGNAFIMKVNPTGSILWVKDYSGINSDVIRDVIELSDGSLVMCGATFSYGEGNLDGFLMKTDSEGTIIWAKSYGNIYGQYFLRVAEDGAGGFYVAGYLQKPPPNNVEGTGVMRVDAMGNVQWVKWSANWSTQGDWYPIDMIPAASGGVVVCGYGVDVWKLSPDGSVEWSKRYIPSGSGATTGLSMIENSQGEILLNYAHVSNNTVGQSVDNCILRLDSTGTFVSNKCYGGLYIDWSRTIANTEDGGTVICGFTNSAGNGDFDASLTKLDAAGAVEWAKAYGGPWEDNSANAVQTSDKGYILTGQTWSEGTHNDSSKVHLMKTDSLGNTACNFVSWTPTETEITASAANPNTMGNFDSLVVNDIDWALNGRSFYTADLCNVLSVASVTEEIDWKVYPNPFSTRATIETKMELREAQIVVTNALGQVVQEMAGVNSKTLTLNRDGLPGGIYFIRLFQDNQVVAATKIVITD